MTFGLWPQTAKVDGVSIYTNRTKVVGSYTYYLGSDFEWYAEKSGDYYKVEPIKWRVVTDSYSGKKLLLSEKSLMHKIFESRGQGHHLNVNDYGLSSIREWLNDDFLNTAFTSEEQSMIPATEVDNSDDSTTDAGSNLPKAGFGYDNTSDQIFLLSKFEVTKNEYDFGAYNNSDSKRKRLPTDFAIAYGAPASGNVGWWLRSPSYEIVSKAQYVTVNGNAGDYKTYVNDDGSNNGKNCQGVVPALCVNP